MKKTAAEAIEHSEQYGEICECEDTPDNREHLLAMCDDHHSGVDFWANDPDSEEEITWRVNIT